MKLLFHRPAHHKNTHAIQQMCFTIGWECEFTHDDNRLFKADYDIVVLNCSYISPDRIPSKAKIIYGPQHWVFPSGPLLGSLQDDLKNRACFNVLSDWNNIVYSEFGSLIVPKVSLPFGVDVERFISSDKPKQGDHCILYIKNRHSSIVNEVLSFLSQRGITPSIFKYGSYNETQYLETLRQVRYMMVLDAHESQGFALQEAMACDVPLLVFDVTSMYEETNNCDEFTYADQKPKNLLATSVPYWSDKCGVRFTDLSQLPSAFDEFKANLDKYNPREFILETLSPHVCMKRILDYFCISR